MAASAGITMGRARDFLESLAIPNASPELLARRALLRRVDTKFILRLGTLQRILGTLKSEYALVRAEGAPVAQYRTLYFDTERYWSLIEHHRGRRPRFKIRIRHYTDRQLTYLEVKKKTNANRTVKARHLLSFGQEGLGAEEYVFLKMHNPVEPRTLMPSLRTDFGRITLVGLGTMERATFDVDLTFRGAGGNDALDKLVIAEVKQDRYRPRSPIMVAFRRAGIRPQSISKYCTAGVLLLPTLSLNRFMPVMHAIRNTTR
jgi:hypothetical protein